MNPMDFLNGALLGNTLMGMNPQGGQPPAAPQVGPQVPPQMQTTPQMPGGMAPTVPGQQPQGQPPPKPLTRQEYDKNKTTWKSVFRQMSQDPDAMAALLVMGNSLLQPKPRGQSQALSINNALLAGHGVLGRAENLRMQLWEKKKQILSDQIKQRIEQQKADSGTMSAEASRTNAEANMMDAQDERGLLGLRKRKIEAEIRKADREGSPTDSFEKRRGKLHDKLVELGYSKAEIDEGLLYWTAREKGEKIYTNPKTGQKILESEYLRMKAQAQARNPVVASAPPPASAPPAAPTQEQAPVVQDRGRRTNSNR